MDDTVITHRREGLQSVSSWQSPELLPNGEPVASEWPSTTYSEVEVPYYAIGITVQTCCNDQDWGNTGFSRVTMVVSPPTSDDEEETDPAPIVKRPLFHINGHGFQERKQVFDFSPYNNNDEELSNAVRPGSVIRIVLESAPYPGYACQCRGATITVRRSGRFHTAITRELLARRMVIDRDDESEVINPLSFVFHDAPKGVFANIMQFTYRF
jgi:hypothetical protein